MQNDTKHLESVRSDIVSCGPRVNTGRAGVPTELTCKRVVCDPQKSWPVKKKVRGMRLNNGIEQNVECCPR